MRIRISEKNIFPSFDIRKEYFKIEMLFCNEGVFGLVRNRGILPASLSYHFILEKYFLSWNLHGTFTSLSEMIHELGISDTYFKTKFPSEERFLDYIQFVVNAINFVDKFVDMNALKYYRKNWSVSNAILNNISLIAEKFNTELIADDTDEIFLSYKNDVSSVISNTIPELRGSIVEYQKFDNKYDIKRKAELLCTFAKTLEPYEKLFKGTEFNSLCSDTTMLMNNSGVRHCIDQNNKIGEKFNSMSADEILKWYDRTFEMFIACMSVVPYLRYKDELKSIKNVNKS